MKVLLLVAERGAPVMFARIGVVRLWKAPWSAGGFRSAPGPPTPCRRRRKAGMIAYGVAQGTAYRNATALVVMIVVVVVVLMRAAPARPRNGVRRQRC